MEGFGARQRGIVAVVVAISLLALLAMVGFALDSGHLVLNKSRLQNTIDASALAAAKVLDQTGSETQATAAARSVFDLNAANHPELGRVLDGNDIMVSYSNTLNPFVAGTTPANYVRVVANDFTMWTSFTSLVGVSDIRTAASAVAGPSAPIGSEEGNEACDLAPMMICGDPAAGAAGNWGYTGDNVSLLKIASNAPSPVGPGNFQLIRLGGPGCDTVRENLAGGYESCLASISNVDTQPGNCTGPVTQGLNTRFGDYRGGMSSADYPPDKVVTQPQPDLKVGGDGVTVTFQNNQPVNHINDLSYSYDDYSQDLVTGPYDFPAGKPQRRVIAVPFVDCTTMVNGQGNVPVLGFGCFFLLQQAVQKGNENFVFGEYIGECGAGGTPGPVPDPDPVGGPGIYKIVLHNDPLSADS
ncbi:MAG: TadE/TadG family type IV pilus assembly protein [Steroidobacteraceae bacterium]